MPAPNKNRLEAEDLVKSFQIYLKRTKAVRSNTIRNYRADLRHFLFWLSSFPASKRKKLAFLSLKKKKNLSLAEKISKESLLAYKNALLANKIVKSTINRKLAVVRSFCQFCHNSGLLRQNLASVLTNLPQQRNEKKEINDLVSRFGSYLKENHASESTIKNYTADLRQYLLSQSKNTLPAQ